MTTLSWEEIEDRAAEFRKVCEKRKGTERQQAQRFVTELLSVFGVENPLDNGGEFEHKTPKEWGDDGYIDYFLPKRIIVEMKSKGKDLNKAFEQLKGYVITLSRQEEVLKTRENHPKSSLADLYDPITMPPDLRKAHQNLDKAVMELYGYTPEMGEPEIVADLMVRYQKLVDAEKTKVSTLGK